MGSCFTLRLELPPNVANLRQHWAVRARQRREWCVRATVTLANTRLRPKAPLGRYSAHVTVVTKRRSDLDNCTARLKPCFDLLKRLGWVVDDGPEHLVSLTVVNAVDTKAPRIEVHLDALEAT